MGGFLLLHTWIRGLLPVCKTETAPHWMLTVAVRQLAHEAALFSQSLPDAQQGRMQVHEVTGYSTLQASTGVWLDCSL